MVRRYQQSALPPTESGKDKGTGRASYFQDVFKKLPTDDNGPLDTNKSKGTVSYGGGDQLGYTYKYDETTMVGTSDHSGKAQYEEFSFSADKVEHVRAEYNSQDTTGSLSAFTYNLAEETSQESCWNFADDAIRPDDATAMIASSAVAMTGFIDLPFPKVVDPSRKAMLREAMDALKAKRLPS